MAKKCGKCGKWAYTISRRGWRCDACCLRYCLECDQRPKAFVRVPGSPVRVRHNRYCLTCLRLGAEDRRKALVREHGAKEGE